MKAVIGALHRECWQGIIPGSPSILPNTMGTTCLRDQEANEYLVSSIAIRATGKLSCILEPGLESHLLTKTRLDANLNTEVMSIQLCTYAHNKFILSLLAKRNKVQSVPFRQTSPTLVGPSGIPQSLSAFKDIHMRGV